MILYHRTPAADEIIAGGFRDGSGSYGLASTVLEGVFVSNVPLNENEGASGSGLLAIEVDEDVLPDYELVQEGAPYREWCVPAALLNQYPVRSISEEEEDALEDEAWLRRMGRRA